MSEDRLERALQEMKDRGRGLRHAGGRAGARVAEGDQRRQRHLCGVPSGLPRVSGQPAGWQPSHPRRGSSQSLPRLSRADRRNERREADHRHARAVFLTVGAMGRAGRCGRTAFRGHLYRTRRHRPHDGPRRPEGHGRFGRRRPVPPARLSAEARSAKAEGSLKQAPPSANTSQSARAREAARCCGSPTGRQWTSTSERSCS